jgi:hypothetical protein
LKVGFRSTSVGSLADQQMTAKGALATSDRCCLIDCKAHGKRTYGKWRLSGTARGYLRLIITKKAAPGDAAASLVAISPTGRWQVFGLPWG